MRLLSLFFILALCLLLILVHMAAGLTQNIRIMQEYEPPTQVDRIEQDRLHELDERLIEIQEKQDELLDIFSSAETFEITAYIETGNQTATGTTPVDGRTVAVDPQVIPYGSKVWIQDIGFRVAEDCGSAVKGKVIDLYVDWSRQDALRFGRRQRLVIPL